MRRCTVAPQDPSSFSEPKPARRNDPILVAEPKPHAAVAQLAHQPIQGRRRIRNTTVFSNFAAEAALGHRHNDRVLVNASPTYVIRFRTTRLLCMRLGTGQSGAILVTCIL
jgi:hypothetical protein